MMFIRSLADFNATPWAVPVTVGAITVTAEATSSPDRHDTPGSGDFYLAINGDIRLAISGDLQLATNGDFHMATDSTPPQRHVPVAPTLWHSIVVLLRSFRGPQCCYVIGPHF
jgi:hypothetical protein